MAHKASDGSAFTNHSTMKTHEAKLQSRGPAMAHEPDGDEEMGAGAEDPQAVVQAHGPASMVELDHQNGHRVMSQHGDGHTHNSEHGSAEQAHEHAKVLSGCGGMQG